VLAVSRAAGWGWVCLGVATALLLVTVYPVTVLAGEVITVGGAGTGLGAMKLLATAYELAHPGISVRVLPSLGSAGGIKAVAQGALDIAISARPLKDNEQGMVAVEYARTPFVFVAHRKVRAHGLTLRELEEIYAGAKTAWPDGGRIRLVLRPETDTDTGIISTFSPGMAKAMRTALGRKGMIVAVTDQECVAAVAQTPGGLGGATLTQLVTEKQPVKVLALEGIIPSVQALAEGRYRQFKTLYLVMPSAATPAARRFADFIRSREGARILGRVGNLVVSTPGGR